MPLDLAQFTGLTPYAFELFGIYQPLLGWQSKRKRRWISYGQGPLDLAAPEGAVVEDEAVPVRGEDERQLEHLRVLERLLQAVAQVAVIVLRLNDGERDVRLVVEDVVGALGLAARDHLAADDDATLGEADLLAELRQFIPAGLTQGRGDEFRADVALAPSAAESCTSFDR